MTFTDDAVWGMKIQGILFDADGTLLDSLAVWDTLASDYLRSSGIEPEAGLDEKAAAWSTEEAAVYFQNVCHLHKSTEQILADIHPMLEAFYKEKARLKPGVMANLESLRKQHIPMCVVTGTDRDLIAAALKRNGVLSFFRDILSARYYGSKETADIYEAGRKVLGTKRENTAVFEDEYTAVCTAKKAGFPVIAVYDRHDRRQKEIKETADRYIEDWRKVSL